MICSLCLAVSTACTPQTAGAPQPTSLSTPTQAAAALLVREIDNTLNVESVGKALYEADAKPLANPYAYCQLSVDLSEAGEFRKGVQAASQALFLGRRSGDNYLMASAARDLAYAYNFAGAGDRADYWASEALRYMARASSRPNQDPQRIFGPVHKTRGDVRFRDGKIGLAIAEYQTALQHAGPRYQYYVRASLARALAMNGQIAEARDVLGRAQEGAPPKLQPYLQRVGGDIAIAAADYPGARAAYDALLASAAGEDADYDRMWALYGRSRVATLQGDRREALGNLREAMTAAERIRARFRSDEFKTGIFGESQAIFDDAIAHALELGLGEDAFDFAERGRARALLDLMRTVATGGGTRPADVGAAAPLARIKAAMPAGTALVAYHVADQASVAWVVRRDAVRVVRLAVRADELTATVRRLRAVMSSGQDPIRDSTDLYGQLIAPLQLAADEAVIVVPHKLLHLLPFQALSGPKGYLIEERAVSYLPSASSLPLIAARSQSSGGTLLALGNPDIGRREMDLPGAEQEVEGIRSIVERSEVHLRKDASAERFMTQAPASGLLHVAAHAMVDEIDPLHSKLYLAPSGVRAGDLEAREVYAVDLSRARLVVLSACESGNGAVANGDEFYGFERTFLAAGAQSLVVSLWAVADEPTPRLM
ncbi:MAG: CHAT domain-containing protein, partial [Alphaproteobacteria bacterium]|nr:CHAT domain-containing protein [Alphaproteobacteria bacterium]